MKNRLILISILILITFSFTGCVSLSVTAERTTQSSTQYRDLSSFRVSNNTNVHLQAGTYIGRLVIDANNVSIRGAGVGKTIIRGDVIINGNANRVRGLTILGSVSVYGNSNNFSGAEVNRYRLTSHGNNNRY